MEFEKLQDIIVDVLNAKKEEVKPETTFVDDLGADSLDVVDMLMSLEDEFDVEIPDDQIEKIRGFDICFVTTAKTDEEARELLRAFGMPFKAE